MLLHLKLVFCRHRILNGFEFGREELNDLATVGTDHVVMVLVFVVMFVVGHTITETNFARQTGFGQEF